MKNLILAIAVAGATLAFAGTASADHRDRGYRGGYQQSAYRYDNRGYSGYDRGYYGGRYAAPRSGYQGGYYGGYPAYRSGYGASPYGNYARPGFSLQFNLGR